MASKNKVRIGDIWRDARGRRLEVTGPMTAEGKVPLRNLDTGRPIGTKGPRALHHLEQQGQGPKITASSARNPEVQGVGRAGPRPAPRQVGPRPAPRQVGPRPAPRPAPRQVGPYLPAAPSKAPLAPMPPAVSSPRQNPSHYSGPLAQAVAVAMSRLSPAQANDPHAVKEAAYRAVEDHFTGAAGRKNPASFVPQAPPMFNRRGMVPHLSMAPMPPAAGGFAPLPDVDYAYQPRYELPGQVNPGYGDLDSDPYYGIEDDYGYEY